VDTLVIDSFQSAGTDISNQAIRVLTGRLVHFQAAGHALRQRRRNSLI
jgi:hypothetical protein